MKWTRIFNEDIYGNKAIVYHRTATEDLINKIYTSGFKVGDKIAYGKGFYSTYDLKSQLSFNMKEKYGNIIVKFIINSLNRFFFFDFSEFVKSPTYKKLKSTKETFIQDQIQYYGINYEGINIKDIDDKYSAWIASEIYENSLNLFKKIDGMVFTNSRDGKVLVCYNTNLLIPISVSTDEGKTFQKYDNKSKEYLQNVFNQGYASSGIEI